MTMNNVTANDARSAAQPSSTEAKDQADLHEVVPLSPSLRGLSAQQVESLLRTARIERIAADQVILREGDKAERIYLVLSGDVDAFGGETLREIIANITRGGVFGGLPGGEPAFHSFATTRNAVLASWDGDALRSAELRAPGLLFQLTVRLSKDTRLSEFSELLQHASLFRNSSSVLRYRLLQEMTLMQFPAETAIYKEGDPTSCCYLVVQGEVEVKRKASGGQGERVTVLERGGVFGEADLLAAAERTESARPTLDTELLAIDRIDVEALRRACGSFRSALFARAGSSAAVPRAQDLILVVNRTPYSTRSISSLLPAAFLEAGEKDAALLEVVPEGHTGPTTDKVLKLPSDPARAMQVLDEHVQRLGNRYLVLYTTTEAANEWLTKPLWDKIIDNRISQAVYFTDDVRHAFPLETPQLAPVQYVEVRPSNSTTETQMVRSGTIRLAIDDARGSDLRYDSLSTSNRMGLQRLARTLSHQVVGVALGGGASWGYAHVALLRALHDAGIPIDMVAGTSIGSIVAVTYGSRRLAGLDTLVEVGTELTLRLGLAPFTRKPVESFIEKRLLDHRYLQGMPIPTLPVAVDIQTGRAKIFRHGLAAQAASMSSAMPAFFVPELRDGVRYVDGGIANNVPVSALVEEGADFIIASNVISAPKRLAREHHKSDIMRLLAQLSPLGRARDALRAMFLLMHEAGARQASAAQITFAPSSLAKFDPFDFRIGTKLIEHVQPELPRFIEITKQKYRAFCQNRDR